MRKILFIESCIECHYFLRETNICGHSEGKSDQIDKYEISEWCPLPDAEEE